MALSNPNRRPRGRGGERSRAQVQEGVSGEEEGGMLTWINHQGNCLEILPKLESNKFHTCITSPPYFGLRDYGCEGQVGLEDTPDIYVAKLVDVFREVKRVLRDDGTLWLNLGDSYFSTTKGSGGSNPETSPKQAWKGVENGQGFSPRKISAGILDLKPKDLVGIPWRVAFALQQDGWYLRSDIIWSKPNPMPESVTDRPTKAHEYIFLLSKSERYYYDAEAIREPTVSTKPAGNKKAMNTGRIGKEGWSFDKEKSIPIDGRNKRTVWEVSTQPFPEAHFATFPQKLIEPCILAGCPENGWVLDPFAGAGTTLYTSALLGRNAEGIELNEEYCQLIERRMAGIHPSLFDFGGDTP